MSKISFKKYVNNIYREQNDFLTNYKKMLFIDNKDSLSCLSIFDIEQYNKLRRPRILNDFINVIKEIKREKNYCFFTITLKDINYKNLTDEEVLKYIKKQYEILKDFQTSIFKKRNDGRNSI
ncbi:MAG: hypothetical protein JXK50_07830 [Campylobacterales bacterium]|nr:hypothetical protein [Campylobacterales bacterium]